MECASPSAFAARHSAASARRRLATFGAATGPANGFKRKDAKAQSRKDAVEISRRDYVIQPSVAATKSRLRWVVDHKLKPTLTWLNQIAVER
jgi:hypothetical protein